MICDRPRTAAARRAFVAATLGVAAVAACGCGSRDDAAGHGASPAAAATPAAAQQQDSRMQQYRQQAPKVEPYKRS